MPDPILKDALARRDAARVEADRWDDFVRMYCDLRGIPYQDEDRGDTVAPAAQRPSQPPTPSPGSALFATEQAAIEILKEVGHPLPTGKLRPLLEERGISIGGKEPNSTLSARLSRAPRLYNDRPRGWWIKGTADDDNPAKDASSAHVERQDDFLTEPQAEGREAVPGGGT